MKRNISGESFVGIIIGIVILSIVIFGIVNLIIYSENEINTLNENTDTANLRKNLSNLIKDIDTSNVLENEVFYLYKNTGSGTFEIFTGSGNSEYKYINIFGDKVEDIQNYTGDIYARTLWVERVDDSLGQDNQIIKASIKKLIKK